ncbi:MAG: hypothetical protein JNK11_03540 [Alphaproteobacteria bacterium]|nr:hypothetical protein [Alphaproteobacteria bacterium]
MATEFRPTGRRRGAARPLLAPMLALAWLLVALLVRATADADALVLAPTFPLELLLLAACAPLLASAAGRAAAAAAAAAVAAAATFRVADAAVAGALGRPISLPWDVAHVPNLAGLVADSAGWPAAAAVVAATAAGTALVLLLTGAAAWTAVRAARARPWAAALLLALPALVSLAGPAPIAAGWPAFGAVAPHLRTMAAWYLDRPAVVAVLRSEQERRAPALRPGAGTLPKLAGHDVFVVVVESYGAGALADPDVAPAARALRDAAAARASTLDLASRSGYLQSPTFGGRSWLAHASLLGGVMLLEEIAYHAFAASGMDDLPALLRRTGHAIAQVSPGLRKVEQPASGLRILGADDLAYDGPRFGWFGIPDAYTLGWARDRLRPALGVAPGTRVFAEIVLVSSHAPYAPAPPALPKGAAWSDAEAWRAAARAADSFAAPDWSQPQRLYAKALAPALGPALDFAVEAAAGGALVLVVGDHQPPAYTSPHLHGDAVIAHAFARDPALLAAFDALGFRRGTVPQGDAARAPDMADVLGAMVAAYGDHAPGGLSTGRPPSETSLPPATH